MFLSLIAYIAAISFQLSGALMMIIFSISTKRKDIVRSFAKSHLIVRNGDTKELSYDHDVFVDTYRTAFFSKISVGYIAVGYLLGIFGETRETRRIIIALFVVAATVVIIMITKLYVCLAITKEKVQNHITDDELRSVGANADMESASSKDIEDLFTNDIKE